MLFDEPKEEFMNLSSKSLRRSLCLTLAILTCITMFCVPTFAASKLKINCTKATVAEDNVIMLTVQTKDKVRWKSSNKNVAKVNTKGVVTARKTGKATITATSKGKKATCKIIVKKYLTGAQAAQLIAAGVLSKDSVAQIVKENSLSQDQVISLIKQYGNNSYTTVVQGLSRSEVISLIEQYGSKSNNSWQDGSELRNYNVNQLPTKISNLGEGIQINNVVITKYHSSDVVFGNKQKYRYHVKISGNAKNASSMNEFTIVYLRSDGISSETIWYELSNSESSCNTKNRKYEIDDNGDFTLSCDQYNIYTDYDEFLVSATGTGTGF